MYQLQMIDEFVLEDQESVGNQYTPRIVKPVKRGIWDKMFSKRKMKKPKSVAVLYLRENGVAEPMVIESKEGFLNIEGRTYHEDRDCIYKLKGDGYPLAIISEWNVTPLGKKAWDDKDLQTKFATLQDHVMKGIRHAERVRMGESEGMKMNGKTMIVIGIMVIIAIAFMWGYR